MAEFDVFHEFGKELEERIRLQTFPLAVKMLEKESDIPEKAQRPMRDFGYRLSSCQGFAISRREGTAVVTMFEDMWCPEAVVGFGLAEAPQYFFDGYHRFPQSVESLEAGSVWAREFPKLKVGQYVGVVSAPLTMTPFEPDVVVMYCDSAQLSMLLLAAANKEGLELTCTVSAKGACVYSVVSPIQNRSSQVTLPCAGNRRFAGAQHDEIIFSVPVEKIEELIASLRYLDEYAYRLPLRCIMQPEAELPENYVVMGKMMGMHWMKGNELAKYR